MLREKYETGRGGMGRVDERKNFYGKVEFGSLAGLDSASISRAFVTKRDVCELQNVIGDTDVTNRFNNSVHFLTSHRLFFRVVLNAAKVTVLNC